MFSCPVIMNSYAIYMEYQELVVRNFLRLKNFYKLKIERHRCTISNEELKIPQATRQQRSITQRSLATLSQKYSESEADGSNLKKANMHDNVIGRAFFDIPLSQVT